MKTPNKQSKGEEILPELEITWQDKMMNFILRFQRYFTDFAGVVLIAISIMALLALTGLTQGALLTPVANWLNLWLGIGSVFVVVVFGVVGVLVIRQHFTSLYSIRWGRILALELAIFALMTLLALLNGNALERAEAGLDGGLIGWGLADLFSMAFGRFLGSVFVALVVVWGSLVGLGILPFLQAWLIRKLETQPDTQLLDLGNQNEAVSKAPLAGKEIEKEQSRPKISSPRDLAPEFRKNFKLPEEDIKPDFPPPPRDQYLPPLALLSGERVSKPNERNINLTAGLIEKTLAEFGIPARVVGFQIGPTVTQFAVEPGFIEKSAVSEEENIRRQKVRVAQISGLSKDLALALSAERLRIQAPVPGRSYIGIEVPNANATMVRLKPILESENFYNTNSPLAIALGRDVSGAPVIADLAKMPHLLIAGTTGSGKSVCISAITTSLVLNNSPDNLRLVMIDPKKVELVRFDGLPHLLGKVETDLERILGVLKWVVAEMDRRYRLLEEYRSRNIQTFNNKMSRRKNPPEAPLPNIVVLIDELADLMMSAADQTEPALVRLAQLARATGIHLVIATQRPSTDVVTGLIKANFPARLAFNVASSIDSRVILDTQGAETLLGRGDMLFLPPEAGSPIRSQGVIVTDDELKRVVKFWQEQDGDSQPDESPWDEMLAQEAFLADRDDLIEKAIEIVKKTQRASASMLQRRLRIGYPRAARLVDELEELGVVGPNMGGGRDRDVLVDPDGEIDYD